MLNSLSLTSTALPAANANTLSTAVDLGPGGGSGLHNGEFLVQVPALPSLADTKNATFQFYDCDTSGGSYAIISGYGSHTVTGVSTSGSAATEFRMPIARHTRRYVKLRIAVDASGGDNTAKAAVFGLDVP